MIINGHLDISSQAIYLQSLVIPVSPKKGYFISFCLLALAQWSFLNKKKAQIGLTPRDINQLPLQFYNQMGKIILRS